MDTFNESFLIIEPLNNSAIDSNTNYGLETEQLYQEGQNSSQYNQILFIDSTVEDYQTLIDNLNQPSEVVILDSQSDGIAQITNSLSNYDSLDAVHIVSHGDTGKLFLGNTVLDSNSLSKYADKLDVWGDFMEEDGDILLYGCNVAADLTGTEFVKSLSEYTEADIQASNDLTGDSDLNGDWDLEYAIGNIETEFIFSNKVEENYGNILTGSVININNVINDFAIANPDSFIAESIRAISFSMVRLSC